VSRHTVSVSQHHRDSAVTGEAKDEPMNEHSSSTISPAETTATLPVSERPPRPRGPRLAIVAVAVAVVGAGIALAGNVGGNDPGSVPVDTVVSSTVPGTTPTVPGTTPTTVAGRLTASSQLHLEGVGPVRIGMTLAEASAAAGVPIRLQDMPPGPECRYAYPEGAPGLGRDVAFMVLDGRIARVDVGDTVRSVSGIGKSSTEAEVQATYPGRIRVEPHTYTPNGRYLVYMPADPALRHLSMLFETENGRVQRFRAGLAGPVAFPEGCS
jgi:hypothetical protein